MNEQYDHYIAVDWSKRNMAIARMTRKSSEVKIKDVPSDVGDLKMYLRALTGRRLLAIEETTTAQWLYTELVGEVERLIVCDPYRNRLLSDGPKTDAIDAVKLVKLLRAGMMKEVYHGEGAFVELRRLVSGYDDVVRAGVRMQNQRESLLRACGRNRGSEERIGLCEGFVLERLEERIREYERDKKLYMIKFGAMARSHSEIRHQMGIPGIGLINAVKVVAQVVNAQRFASKGHYWSYCGLIKHDKVSGGKSYGKRESRFCRGLKSVYKTAAFVAISGNNEMRKYYDYLMREKGVVEQNARNAVARRISQISLGVLRSGKAYQAGERGTPGKEQHPGS